MFTLVRLLLCRENTMAKKKGTKAKSSVGAGKKQCPNCGEIIAARSRECPHCHHTFVAKERQETAPPTPELPPPAPARQEVDVATIVAAHELIKRCGGIRQAKAALEAAEQAAKESRTY